MGRKVLLAEQVDATRSAAESVLRQNGYEVIAVTAAEKAREVLNLSQPDLIIVGADLLSPDGTPFFERLREDSQTSSIPMLLFEAADHAALDFPDELLIRRPVEPHDFVRKVTALTSQEQDQPEATGEGDDSGIDEDLLDAALGLDRLDVTESEVMDQTVGIRRKKKRTSREKMVGYESEDPLDDTDSGMPAVESLVIDEDSSQVRRQESRRQEPSPNSSGKLDIRDDPYGLAEGIEPGGAEESDPVHDYDWFVDAIREDVKDPKQARKSAEDVGELHITSTSETVDPVTPGPSAARPARGPAAVEQFIDEFKREMEQIRDSEELPLAAMDGESDPSAEAGQGLKWEDKAENLGPAQIDLFMREFAHRMADKVAAMIAEKIDRDKLLRLIKAELTARSKKG